MYVAILYFVFIEAMVSWLINGECILYVWNSCCLLQCVPKLRENSMMPLCFICFSLCGPIHLMDRIDVIVSCMIIRERLSLLRLFYRDCVGRVSYVNDGTHSSSVHGLKIDSWSRDATSSSIIAYFIPGLHLHFYLSTPLPDIIIFCSLLHNFHVFMDPSASILNSSLNLNWLMTYLDSHCQGSPRGVFLGHFWNLEIGDP